MTEITTATTPPAKLSIKDSVLAQFKEAELTIVGLAEKYKNVVYAVATPSGMRDAIAARADLRDNGRLFVTKSQDRIKGEVNDLKRVMADETERLVSIVKPVEDSIDAQIKVEEKRKADEKAERDRKEAERVAVHRVNIDKIKGYVARAEGKPIETIERGVTVVSAMEFGPEWEEFAAEATAARDAAVVGLNKLIDAERQRIESERLKQELADARAALAAANAKAAEEATRARIQAEEQAKAEKAVREKLERDQAAETKRQADIAAFEKLEAEETARLAKLNATVVVEVPASTITKMVAVLEGDDTPPVMLVERTPVATVLPFVAPARPAPSALPTLKLGDIGARLAPISISGAGLSQLGFEPSAINQNSRLYYEHEFPLICAALVKHLQAVQAKQAA